jgi:hypothetical protein
MPSLFAFELFEITPIGLFALIGWAVAGVCLGKLAYRDDRKLKELQREASDLADELARHGFQLLPPILHDIGFLDFIKLKLDFKHAVNVLKDPVKRQAEFATLLDGMVQYELSDKKSNQAFFDDVIRKALANGLKVNLPGVAVSAAAEPPAATAPAAR